MSKDIVELDFLGIQEQNAAELPPTEQRSSTRGIQSVTSRIDPQLLRSVIAGHGVSPPGPALPSPGSRALLSPPPIPLPVLYPATGSVNESLSGTALLTIFYNGTVNVFDVVHDKAEAIIKLAEELTAGDRAEGLGPGREACLLDKLDGDLPIARRKSLQRFLEKRKERIQSNSPLNSTAKHFSKP